MRTRTFWVAILVCLVTGHTQAVQRNDRLANRFDPQASGRKHFGRDAARLAQQPEQQVFGAYVVVQQLVGFTRLGSPPLIPPVPPGATDGCG